MDGPLIRVADVHKVYKTGDVEVHALRGVSLDVSPGEFVAIMGSSGSGKSTLMNLLGCLDRPTRGSYRLAGREVGKMSRGELAEVRNEVLGFVFQSFNLLARTSALENVELPLVYRGVRAGERRRRAEEALEKVGLGARLDHTPAQLSGGQQQRVAIARALAMEPEALLLDEPTSALDPERKAEVVDVLAELAAGGATMIVVTHEAAVVRAIAHRAIVLDEGRIVRDGPPGVDGPDPG